MNFKEINQINVSQFIESKQGSNQNYISWSNAWELVKKIDDKANFIIHENNEGNPFWSTQFGIDVKVSVTINGLTHTMRLPVLDGANNALKSEPYTYTVKKYVWDKKLNKRVEDGVEEKTVLPADAGDINKTIMRCLVKAIAIHGLGLYIYHGETSPRKGDITKKITSVQLDEVQTLGLVLLQEFNHEVKLSSDPQTWDYDRAESAIVKLKESIAKRQLAREQNELKNKSKVSEATPVA